MRHVLLVAMLVVPISSPVICRASAHRVSTIASVSVEQELIELERHWNDAFLKKNLATLKSIMADDIVIVYGDGSQATKAEDIASIGKGEQIETSMQDEFQVRVYGDAAVVMSRLTSTGVQRGSRSGRSFDISTCLRSGAEGGNARLRRIRTLGR